LSGGFEAKQCFELRVASPSHVMTQSQKSFWLHDQLLRFINSNTTCSFHACGLHLRATGLSPGMDAGRASGNLTASSKHTMHTEHVRLHSHWRPASSTANTTSRVPPPYLRWDISTVPTASHVLSIFESRIPSCLTTPSTVIAEPKDFSAERRLQLSCRAHAASFQLSNSTHCTVATGSRLPHLVNTGILAKVGALADLAIPCFCLKPSSTPWLRHFFLPCQLSGDPRSTHELFSGSKSVFAVAGS
jgi:hypothetical protein